MKDVLNFAVAVNEHADVVNRIVYEEIDTLKGVFTLDDFKRAVSLRIKNKNVNIFLLDATVAKTKEEIVEYAKYLRTIKENMRIILIAPNLRDEQIMSTLVSFGIYDIVAPQIKKEDGFLYGETLTNAINFCIESPKTFAMVAHLLKTETKTATGEKYVEIQSTLDDKNIRTYMVYKNNKVKNKILPGLEGHKTFNLVGSSLYNANEVSKLNLLKVDLLLLEEPTEDEVYEILNIAKVLKNQIKIVCFFQDFKLYESVISIPNVNCVIYDGTFADFERSVRETFIEKIRKATQEAKNNRSKVIAIASNKGGSGKTTLACLLADTFKKKATVPLKVCVVDFDMFSGDLAVKYGIEDPVPNLYQWVKEIHQKKRQGYNIDFLKDQIINYTHYIKEQEIYVMPTTYTNLFTYTDFSLSSEEVQEAYSFTIDALKEVFDVIILDTGVHPSGKLLALHKASDILLCSDATLPGVYQLRALYGELVADEYVNVENIKIVVMKAEDIKKEHEYMNVKLIKSFYEGDTYIMPFDKKLSYNFDCFTIKPSKALSAKMLQLCADITPVFGNKGKR